MMQEPAAIVANLYKGWAFAAAEADVGWFDRHLASDFLFTSHLRRDCTFVRSAFALAAIEAGHADIGLAHLSAERHGAIILSHMVLDTAASFTAFGPRSRSEHDTVISHEHGCAFASGWRLVDEVWRCFSQHEVAFVHALSDAALVATKPSTDEALTIVSDAYREWATILERGEFGRMDVVLADDFTMLSHVVPGPPLDKRAFIRVGSQIEDAKLTLRTIWADAVGELLLSRVTLDVEEVFKADLGPGMPPPEEVTRLISGHRLGYASAWRRQLNNWQCFNHHMFGPVD